jgi:dTDP-4-amino-4,6-dideoxygalactose transaminase
MKSSDIPTLEGGTPTRKSFLVFGRPKITDTEIREVTDTLKSGWIGTGPKTALFEQKIASYTNAKYAIALNSCTAGLHLSLLACGVKQGDEVITSPMTFAATVNVIEHVGAKPIFADVDRTSMNIDPKNIEKHVSSKTKAIIPVHMAGRPCDMEFIHRIAKKHNLRVIEDAAHALGATYKGKPIGCLSDTTVFSFYVTKNLTTSEGGMVTTNNKDIADFIRIYSLHGLNKGAWKRYSESGFKNYVVEAPGYKYNMTDIQASIGLAQFKEFHNNQNRRKQIWNIYMEQLKDLPLYLPSEIESNTTHAYHLFTILLDIDLLRVNRDYIQSALCAENIGVGTHFIAVHLHPYYQKKYGFSSGSFPNAEWISERTISIPLSADMSSKDVTDTITTLRKVLTYYQSHSGRGKKLPPSLSNILQTSH